MADAPIHLWLDVTDAASARIRCWIDVDASGPEGTQMAFPRWIPGSYVIRDPVRMVRDLCWSSSSEFPPWDSEWAGSPVERIGVNRLRMGEGQVAGSRIRLGYEIIADELSVRTNHATHAHAFFSQAATWWIPEEAVLDRKDSTQITLTARHPAHWQPFGPWCADGSEMVDDGMTLSHLTISGLEAWMDSPLSFSEAAPRIRSVGRISLEVTIVDIAGAPVRDEAAEKLCDDAARILVQQVADLGDPGAGRYALLLLLTSGERGGLEHRWGQVSMMGRTGLTGVDPRKAMDLRSLISHEFTHLWNVRNLRPRSFECMNLEVEAPEPMLWWFEGVTSYYADIACWRSGVWSEAEYREEMERKIRRHLGRLGPSRQSVADSAQLAWVEGYRPDCWAAEARASYYLEGELIGLALDAELRHRTNDAVRLLDVISEANARYGLGGSIGGGLDHDRLKKVIGDLAPSTRLGRWLDQAISNPARPNLVKAFGRFGLRIDASSPDTPGQVLGAEIASNEGGVVIRRVHSDVPARSVLRPGDEVIAVDGLRIRSSKALTGTLQGAGEVVNLTVARHGIIITLDVALSDPPAEHKLTGRGNSLWRSTIADGEGVKD